MTGERATERQEPVATEAVANPRGPVLSPAGGVDVLALQRTAGNRATGRLLRSAGGGTSMGRVARSASVVVARDPAKATFDWSEYKDSLSSSGILESWLAAYPVTPLEPKDESAYNKGDVEPDPLGCMWNGSRTTLRAVAQRFMSESTTAGQCFDSGAVLRAMRDRLAHDKHLRADDQSVEFFLSRSNPKPADGKQGTIDPFPWQAYAENADQFTDGDADPKQGAAGPIRDWLSYYEFDAVWPEVKDQDTCLLTIEGTSAGARVPGVVRLYHTEAVKAGFLGVDHAKVDAFVRKNLDDRKQRKRSGKLDRPYDWDGRGIRDDRRAKAFGTAKVTVPPDPPDPKLQIQFQGNFTKHTNTKTGQKTTDPTGYQVTASYIALSFDTTARSQLQFTVQASASWAVNNDKWELTELNITNVQGAAQGSWSYDLVKDLLQAQVFVQAVGGANVTVSTPVGGRMTLDAAAMGQAVAGGQLNFIVPGTKKRLVIFLQGQASKTVVDTGRKDPLITNDQQVSIGISYAIPGT